MNSAIRITCAWSRGYRKNTALNENRIIKCRF